MAKSDKKATKIVVKYLEQTNQDIDFAKYPIEKLDEMLSVFWFVVSPEKQGADHYSVSSLHHIRYAIKRILQSNGRDFDITMDPKFAKSQRMFKEACKELKRKGFRHVKHTDVIKPQGRSTSLSSLETRTFECIYLKNLMLKLHQIFHRSIILDHLFDCTVKTAFRLFQDHHIFNC